MDHFKREVGGFDFELTRRRNNVALGQAPVWVGKNAVFPGFPNSKVRKSRIFPRGISEF